MSVKYCIIRSGILLEVSGILADRIWLAKCRGLLFDMVKKIPRTLCSLVLKLLYGGISILRDQLPR